MEKVWISVLSLGGIGLLFGIVLSFLDKKLKVKEDPKVNQVNEVLPGVNCGACGFAGCKAYAKAAVKEKSLFGGCKPGGQEINEKLASILGVGGVSATKQKAVAFCGADFNQKKSSFLYRGPKTCSLANQSLGVIDCKYGCLALGDCIDVCPTKALSLDNGRIKVDYGKCIGCGKCIEVCPRNIFELIDIDNFALYVVACRNPEDAFNTKKVCTTGCIGCGICVKLVKDSPFYLEEGLSKVKFSELKDKDTAELDKGKDKCPVNIIKKIEVKR